MKIRKIICFLILGIVLVAGCGRDRPEKIQLADSRGDINVSEAGSDKENSIEQKVIAIYPFKNQSALPSIAWLQNGIAEMLRSDLSQSVSLKTIPIETVSGQISKLGLSPGASLSHLDIMRIGKGMNANGAIFGEYLANDSSVSINYSLMDLSTGKIKFEKSISGSGLPELFALVDQLSKEIKQGLKLASRSDQEVDFSIADFSTASIEAYEKYISGQHNLDRFFNNEAMIDLEEAVKIDTSFATAFSLLSQVYLSLGKVREAVGSINKAMELADKLPVKETQKIEFNRAMIFSDWPEVISKYKLLNELGLDDPYVHYNYGLFQRGQIVNYEDALEAFTKAIELKPDFSNAYNEIAYLHSYMGDYKNALDINKKYLELIPDTPNPYDSRAEIHSYFGKFDEAVKSSGRALKIKPDFHYSLQGMGDFHFKTGKYDQAIGYYKKAEEVLSGTPLQADPQFRIALVYWAKGDLDKAYEQFTMLNKSLRLNFGTYFPTYQILIEKNEKEKAEQLKKDFFENYINTENLFANNIGIATGIGQYFAKDPEYAERFLDFLKQQQSIPRVNVFKMNLEYLESVANYTTGNFTESANFMLSPPENVDPVFFRGLANRTWIDFETDIQILSKALELKSYSIGNFEEFLTWLEEMSMEKTAKNFRTVLAHFYTVLENKKQADKIFRKSGVPREELWKITGPLDMRTGLNTEYPPDKNPESVQSFSVNGREFKWENLSDGYMDGFINLGSFFERENWCAAYSRININSKKKQNVYLSFSAAGTFTIWVNKKHVLTYTRNTGGTIAGMQIPVKLKKGKNQILLKVNKEFGDWGFYFRVTDKDGSGIEGIEFKAAN